jgi:hypothetical protein
MCSNIAIFPDDPTISFLFPLKDLFKELGIPIITFSDEVDSISKAKECLKREDISKIFFFGHGSSYCLYGPKQCTFLKEEDLELLKGKTIIALACRSEEFLANKCEDITYLGFGNLPTDWGYIEGLRDIEDPNAYEFLSEELVKLFSDELCNVFKRSILEASKFDLDVLILYKKLQLHFNKIIAETLVSKSIEGYREFVDFVYGIRTQMKINLLRS